MKNAAGIDSSAVKDGGGGRTWPSLGGGQVWSLSISLSELWSRLLEEEPSSAGRGVLTQNAFLSGPGL